MKNPLTLAPKILRFGLRILRGDAFAIHQLQYRFFPRYYRARYGLCRPFQPTQKNLFLDLGANVGGGFQYFSQLFPTQHFHYVFFEPNPHSMKQLQTNLQNTAFPHGKTFEQKAVFTRNETLQFFGLAESNNLTSEGASLMATHNQAFYEADQKSAIQVPAINFAQYFKEIQKAYDFIVIKMDIEGAELDVLEHLWQQPELFQKPTLMFTEFHSIYLKGSEQTTAAAREKAIVKNAPANVTFHRWF